MTQYFALLLLTIKVWSSIESNDQCCYFYGSAPRNESNCIPDGQQLQLHCLIYNPRDTFTNLSVQWFRSSDMSAPAEDIADIQDADYILFTYFQTMTSLQINCTQGRLYADTFILGINNFNTNKDGYYWCNILVNDSFLEPSQRARFYAIEGTSCIRQDPYFRPVPDEAQCASGTTSSDDHTDAMTTTMSTTSSDDHTDAITTTMSTTSSDDHTDAMTTTIPTTSSDDHSDVAATTMPTTLLDDHSNNMITTTVTQPSTPDMTSTTVLTTLVSITNTEPILYYAIGVLAVLVLLVGALMALMLILYVHKSQKEMNLRNRIIRERHGEMENEQYPTSDELENEEYDDICAGRATVNKEESHVYQALKLNEMNCESMYAKIMPTRK